MACRAARWRSSIPSQRSSSMIDTDANTSCPDRHRRVRSPRMDAAQVKQFFERVASDWDSMRLAWYDERVIEELANRAHANPSTTVLDVGTGTGFVAAGLAPQVAHVIAVDHSRAMLETAERNLRELGLTNVELLDA